MEHVTGASLEELFERYADTVYRYLRVRLPVADAEEVTQDVFVVAWRKPEQIPDNAIAWLLGVARKLAANRRRVLTHRDEAAQDYSEVAEAFFPDHAGAVGEADAAARALRRLSPADRAVIQLLVAQDLSSAQVGDALGCSPATAAVRVHRARARLKASFDAEDQVARGSPGAARDGPQAPQGPQAGERRKGERR